MENSINLKRIYRGMIRGAKTIWELIKLLPKRTKKKVFLLGTPEHDNLGDHAIAIAEREWIRDNFSGYDILEFTDNQLTQDLYLRLKLLPLLVGREDYVFLPGGGNIGDRYPYIEGLRRRIIKYFKKTPIVVFPQSMYFSQTESGKKEEEITRSIYNSHLRLTLLFRDEISYNNGKKIFQNCKVMLMPDIVTYLNKRRISVTERRGVLFCMRSDIETYFPQKDIKEIEIKLTKNNEIVKWSDTSIRRNINMRERVKLVDEMLNLFGSYKVVVTDRFHGLIFSVITGTPCVVLRSSDHKIVEGVKWFKGLNYIFYVDSISKVYENVQKAMRIRQVSNFNFREKYFQGLKALIYK